MAILAKLAAPNPAQSPPSQPVLEQALGGKITLFSAPAGYLYTNSLARLITDRQMRLLWLRAGPEDRDPATLLLSLVTGAEAIFPSVGARTLETLRHQPGSIYGWAALFALLAHDISEAASGSGAPGLAIVIQHADTLTAAPISPAAKHLSAPRTSAEAQPLGLLWEHFLPLLPRETTRVVTSHTALPRAILPRFIQQIGANELRLSEQGAALLAQPAFYGPPVNLPRHSLHRLVSLTAGRGVLIDALLALGQSLGSDTLQAILEAADSLPDLLNRAARAGLEAGSARTAKLLTLAVNLEYVHPALIKTMLGGASEAPAGWIQSLDEGWSRVRCIWREPARALLNPYAPETRDLLKRAAQHLVQQSDFEGAIPLLMDLDEPREAARVLVQMVEPLMDHGQWETLSGWLARLPEAVRRDWPWLVYAEGELSAVWGHPRSARRIFAQATQLFYDRRDYKGASQSLLTESTLAAWDDEPARAREFAQRAQSLAQTAGLAWHQGWASWQLGSLAAEDGQMEEALSDFSRAASAAGQADHTQMAEFVEQARRLAQLQIDLRQQQEQHRRALQESEQTALDAAARLHFLLDNPADQAGRLMSIYGWSQMPLFLKLPQPAVNPGGLLPTPDRLINLLLERLRPKPRPETAPPDASLRPAFAWGEGTPARPAPADPVPLPITGREAQLAPSPAAEAAAPQAAVDRVTAAGTALDDEADDAPADHDPVAAQNALAVQPKAEPAGFNSEAADPETEPAVHKAEPAVHKAEPGVPKIEPGENNPERVRLNEPPAAPVAEPALQKPRPAEDEPITGPLTTGKKPVMSAYLLGPFRVILNDATVDAWPSGRARAVFAFLLTQRGRPIQREMIMETFWPEASPESARNSLNVAIYSLRQTLKANLGDPMVLFHNNAYQISPDLPIWLDFDSFERHVQAGHKAEAAGHMNVTIRHYEMAISLYQGDLLSDNLYEDWPVVERERLHVIYMETLEHLSLIYFNMGQYAACAALCQRMLGHDNCREDAHCRLMRCYHRQGQSHLALRQYQTCVEALRTELDVPPSPNTIRLYEQIKRRESI